LFHASRDQPVKASEITRHCQISTAKTESHRKTNEHQAHIVETDRLALARIGGLCFLYASDF
jgi:hypothetical protein